MSYLRPVIQLILSFNASPAFAGLFILDVSLMA